MAGDAIRFTDGTTTVTFADTDIVELGIVPPGTGAASATQRAVIVQTTVATARSNIASVNRLIEKARRALALGTSERVYVEVRTQTSDTYYRSVLFDGAITPDTEAFSAVYYGNDYLKFEITFTHAPWWEGADTQIAISNTNGSNNTAGLTVENHYDVGSGIQNSFTVAAGVTTGDAPSNVRLELTNTSGTALGYAMVGVLQNSAGWPGYYFYQGEGYASAQSGSSTTANGAASNGNYLSLSVPGSSVIGASSWTVSGAGFAVTEGRQVVPVARLFAAPSQTIYGATGVSVATAGGGTEWIEISTTGRYVIFPPIAWPPGANGGPYSNGSFTFNTLNTGSSTTLALDYFCLFPTDGLRQYRCSDTIVNGAVLIDDCINGYTYVSVSSNRTPGVITYGNPLQIMPGQATTFVLLFSDTASRQMLPSWSVTAKLYYRPRRFTI